MKKKYYFAIIPFVLGVGCLVAYSIIGAKVALDGTLIESFWFIPTGLLLIATGTIIAIITSTLALFHSPSKFDKWVFGLSLGFIILSSLYLFASMSYLSEQANVEVLQ